MVQHLDEDRWIQVPSIPRLLRAPVDRFFDSRLKADRGTGCKQTDLSYIFGSPVNKSILEFKLI